MANNITINPILKRIYENREIKSYYEIDYNIRNLVSYNGIPNIELSSEKISYAIKNDNKILIIGDYDLDGASSTALAVKSIREMGANNVSFYSLNRFNDGHEISKETAKKIIDKFSPDLVLTVDCGIRSFDGITAFLIFGIDVIVCDHHIPDKILPPTKYIVNPLLKTSTFSSKNLAGVGVVFYLIAAVRFILAKENWFYKNKIETPNMTNYLDLVAIGTIADQVKLDYTNRILVENGLKKIRNKNSSLAINLMVDDLFGKHKNFLELLNCSDISFYIAPMFNSVGRLFDMKISVEFLLSKSIMDCKKYLNILKKCNKQRKNIEKKILNDAELQLAAFDKKFEKFFPKIICLIGENWHQGVIGIIASRLLKNTNKPVIIFSKCNNNIAKGSCRSTEDTNLIDLLLMIKKHSNLEFSFGGHSCAAGLSIDICDFEKFCFSALKVLSQNNISINNKIKKEKNFDLGLDECDITIDTAKLIRIGGPWGNGFPEPIFFGKFYIIKSEIILGKHIKLSLKICGKEIFGILYNAEKNFLENLFVNSYIEILYKLNLNFYRSNQYLELLIEKIINL